MKVSFLRVIALALGLGCFIGVFTAHAGGVRTGNTGFLTGVEIQLTSEHPMQKEILERINKIPFPVRLKEKILEDFATTSILTSSEVITYKDLQATLKMELARRTKEIRTVNGQVEEKIIEEYIPVRRANELGFYVYEAPLPKVPNKDELPLASITTASPRRVVYFTEVLKKMSPDAVAALVFHEQAHRMRDVFGELSTDERFADGWGNAMVSFLSGTMNQSQFHALLKQNNLNLPSSEPGNSTLCGAGDCFPNENVMPGPQKPYYYSDINFAIEAKHVLANEINEHVVVHIDSKALADYKPLLKKNSFALKIWHGSEIGQIYSHLQNEIKAWKTAVTPSVIPARIVYEKKVIELDGKFSYDYIIHSVYLLRPVISVDEIKTSYPNITEIFRDFKIMGNHSFAYTNPFYNTENTEFQLRKHQEGIRHNLQLLEEAISRLPIAQKEFLKNKSFFKKDLYVGVETNFQRSGDLYNNFCNRFSATLLLTCYLGNIPLTSINVQELLKVNAGMENEAFLSMSKLAWVSWPYAELNGSISADQKGSLAILGRFLMGERLKLKFEIHKDENRLVFDEDEHARTIVIRLPKNLLQENFQSLVAMLSNQKWSLKIFQSGNHRYHTQVQLTYKDGKLVSSSLDNSVSEFRSNVFLARLESVLNAFKNLNQ